MIVLMAGLPGTGKTTLASELAARMAGRVLNKDDIRHSLFLAEEIEYSTRQDDFCLQVMLQMAGHLLGQNGERTIFLDGRTFSRRYQIENVIDAAASLHQSWRILECTCAEDIIERRLEKDVANGAHRAVNRDFEMYLDVKSRFEAITLPRAVIDTGAPWERCFEQALSSLR